MYSDDMPSNIGALIAAAILACLGCSWPIESGKAPVPIVAQHKEKGLKVNPTKASPDYDPDEEFPAPDQFKKLHTPAASFIGIGSVAPPKFSTDGKWVTFTFLTDVRNNSCVQLAEVEITSS